MTDRITELYQSAGVDTDGFEHRVRARWNKSSHNRRRKVLRLASVSGWRKPLMRWDELEPYDQAAILRSIENQQKEKHDGRHEAN